MIILVDSVFRTGKNYYPQVKNVSMLLKKKKIPKYIIDDIEISSDSAEENSDEENCDKDNSNEKNYDEEN